jgi:hypothetical protein
VSEHSLDLGQTVTTFCDVCSVSLLVVHCFIVTIELVNLSRRFWPRLGHVA